MNKSILPHPPTTQTTIAILDDRCFEAVTMVLAIRLSNAISAAVYGPRGEHREATR